MKDLRNISSKALTGASLASVITLFATPAWACGPVFAPLRGPGEFLFIWILATIFVGWMGSLWTLGALWKFRKRLGGWRVFLISVIGAPALGLIATLLTGVVDVLDLGHGATNFDQTFWGFAAVGMAAVYQTGYSLGAYRLFRKRNVVIDE